MAIALAAFARGAGRQQQVLPGAQRTACGGSYSFSTGPTRTRAQPACARVRARQPGTLMAVQRGLAAGIARLATPRLTALAYGYGCDYEAGDRVSPPPARNRVGAEPDK